MAGYQGDEADMRAVCELAEVLRDAVIRYQVRVNLEVPDQPIEFFSDALIACTTEGRI